jgi:hypothetical protein
MTRILNARRCESHFGKQKTSKMDSRSADGIRYERRLAKSLTALANERNLKLEYQPWFEYTTGVNIKNYCAPDFLLYPPAGSWLIVIDAKRSFYQEALNKLQTLYVPVVSESLLTDNFRLVYPLMICRNLDPNCPKPIEFMREAITTPLTSVYHWLGQGSLVW